VEVTFLVKWILEINSRRFGSSWALDWSLWLWSGGFTEEKACIFHSFWAGELKDTSAITNGEWFESYGALNFCSFVVFSSWSWDLVVGRFSFEVSCSSTFKTLNFNSIGSWFIRVVSKLKDLNKISSKCSLES
jgi:hypothetical protein